LIPKQLQDRIDKLPEESRILIELIISIFSDEIDRLKTRIKELEDQISKTAAIVVVNHLQVTSIIKSLKAVNQKQTKNQVVKKAIREIPLRSLPR